MKVEAVGMPLDLAETWEVPRVEVDDMVAHLFTGFRVLAFYMDVAGWESYVDKWSVEYGDGLAVKASSRSAVGWDMRSRTEKFVQRGAETMHAAILDGTLIHTGHPVLRRHVLAAGADKVPDRSGKVWAF